MKSSNMDRASSTRRWLRDRTGHDQSPSRPEAFAKAQVVSNAESAPELGGDTLLYEPPSSALAPPPIPAVGPADAALLAILRAPLSGESAMAGFARKEIALRDAITSIPAAEARTLHLRLSNPRPEDVLAQQFGRLTSERRSRLLAFVADARRREALAASGRH
jgi:hypothetical protein